MFATRDTMSFREGRDDDLKDSFPRPLSGTID